jgi:heme-degrading monooxygenase HmoA
MVARVSVYDIPPERIEEAEDGFREVLGQISTMEGLRSLYLLMSRESSRAMVVTLWDGHDSMAASGVTAARLRTEVARAVDGEVLSVEELDVVVHEEGALA